MSSYKKIGIAGVVLFIFGLIVFTVFPILLKQKVTQATQLQKNSSVRETWEKFPIPQEFKIYLFNVTNSEDVKNGAKPIVQEVGPFIYDEWKEKVNLEDDEEDDSIEYSNKVTWIYNPDKTPTNLTEDVQLIFPHVIILSILIATLRERPGLLDLAGKSIDKIFHKPRSIFIKTTPRELLWDGIPIDCTSKDILAQTVCTILRGNKEFSSEDDQGSVKFALFGSRNNTIMKNRMTVNRGIKNYLDIGAVTKFNGESKLNIWDENGTCNSFDGTDSTIFHPYLYENEDLVSFTPDFCRSIPAKFQNYSNVNGIPTNRYTMTLGNTTQDPELKCLCPKAGTCLKGGLFDIYLCAGAPIILSLPHFYLVDEVYLMRINGLEPDEGKHETFIEFEPITGTVINARKRIQFNMFVFPVETLRIMKNYPHALLPLFWIEEGVLLPDDFLQPIKELHTLIMIINIIAWSTLVGGIILGLVASIIYYKIQQKMKKLDIIQISMKSVPHKNLSEKTIPPAISNIQVTNIPTNVDSKYIEKNKY